ncbi:DUF3846 domain-containing protein [Kineosporia babensis]|uniref:DUF3846 domain-containing protein n=1 Tax=Kineosporia babensis TaxID=499548 RepID=A0A9X1NL62_9ACTN|nr:hypothetical protein [Kineosporia babensis]MCD5316982.1 hypothetical protein [Kineosporia babensis]
MAQPLPELHHAWHERVAALVIPAQKADPVRLTVLEGQQIRALQRLVRGTSASIGLPALKATLHINEEGAEQGLPTNDRARLLAWAHAPAERGKTQVAADAVILGPAEGGRNRSVPAELSQLLVSAQHFQLQAEYRDRPGIWLDTSDGWTSWHEAYTLAVGMLMHNHRIHDIRVRPVDRG